MKDAGEHGHKMKFTFHFPTIARRRLPDRSASLDVVEIQFSTLSGKSNDNDGTNVTAISNRTINPRKGRMPLITSETGALETPDRTNRLSPTGGVSIAISMLITTMITAIATLITLI